MQKELKKLISFITCERCIFQEHNPYINSAISACNLPEKFICWEVLGWDTDDVNRESFYIHLHLMLC